MKPLPVLLVATGVVSLVILGTAAGAAAGQAGSPPAVERPVIHAVRLQPGERIVMDGHLDEEGWSRAEPATDFRQFAPRNGAAATQASDIRVLFDEDSLYIGGKFFDDHPERLLGNQMIRDGALDADDRFIWVLDPFNDRRSGYYFEVNPAGAMGDAQLIPAQGGTSFGVTQNRAWDGIWLARVVRHEEGWTVEVRIPFRTLNFDPSGRPWGINFQRTVRRLNEETFWSGWGRNEGINNLASVGHLEGIRDVSQGHGLDVKPYVIGTHETPIAGVSPGNPAGYDGKMGVDFFYSLTPQIKANVTVNTDFAQTEVDDRQVNLTRFPLFFPEKRDFFLEGAGNFDFSREQAGTITAFFTRRIGLDEVTGQPQKIDYGARIAGRAGQYNLGVMHVRTGSGGAPGASGGEEFTVFRPKRLFFTQSYAGLIYTRRATRDGSVGDRHTVGADFSLATARFRGDHNLQFAGFFLKTPNPGKYHNNEAAAVRIVYPNDRWVGIMAYKYFGRNVDPAVGFVEQVGFQKWTPQLTFAPRPKNSRLVRQYSFDSRNEFYTDMAGRLTQRTYFLTPLRVDFHSGDYALVQIDPTYDRLEEDFRIRTGQRTTITLPRDGEYHFTRYTFRVNTANRRKVSGAGTVVLGTFYSGTRTDWTGTVNLRPRRGVLATITGTINRVDLAEGRFSTKIVRGIVNTQFSPFISVTNNVQYDTVSGLLGWQSRLRWIVKPGDDLYFVWLNNWVDTDNRLAFLDRNAAAKMVYTFRF
jgi:hypothetical protein